MGNCGIVFYREQARSHVYRLLPELVFGRKGRCCPRQSGPAPVSIQCDCRSATLLMRGGVTTCRRLESGFERFDRLFHAGDFLGKVRVGPCESVAS